MGEFYLMNWIVVLGALAALVFIWGYPLAILCRRAGKSTAPAWLAATIGLCVGGPIWCIWWLALSTWNTPPPKS